MIESSVLDESSTKKREIQKIIGINTPMIMPETQYFVKYNNLSYRECNFITREELLSSSISKYLELKLRKQPFPFRPVAFFPDLYKPTTIDFDEGYIMPEKVIADQFKNGKQQYLIKWMSLDYDECTWEDKDSSIPQSLIHEYLRSKEKFNAAYSKSSLGNLFPPKHQYLDQRRKISQYHEITESIEYSNGNFLLQHQIDGINWLHKNWILHRNSILADDNGLGQIIQSLCFLNLLDKNYGVHGPFLILTPLLSVVNWITQIKEWTNFRTVSLTGNNQSKKIIKKYCLYYNGNDQSKLIFDILIVPIDSIKREISILSQIYFMVNLIDEDQRFYTNIDLYRQCQDIKADFTLLIKQSPLHNDINELWPILHFIDSKNFSNFELFNQSYSNKDEKLQEAIKPYFLRRLKSDIKEPQIVLKEETLIDVEMTPFQRSLYKAVLKENREILIQNIFKTKASLNSISTELKKVCDHPYLLKDAKTVFIDLFRKKSQINESEQNSEELILNALVSASGKLILLDKLLLKLLGDNRKIVIFSQMARMIDIIDDYLYSSKFNYERLELNKNLYEKKMVVERFNTSPDSCVLLLSNSSADDIGLDLKEADTVIIFDSDFSTHNDIQNQARCFRIGQMKEVKVYRFLTKFSFEELMFNYAFKELKLDCAFFDSDQIERFDDQISPSEIELLLKKSAHYIFNDQCSDFDHFWEENIDQILGNRTRTIKLDEQEKENPTFSKFSPYFDQNRRIRESVDFESPDFWPSILSAEIDDLPEMEEKGSSLLKNDHYSINGEDQKAKKDGEDDEAEFVRKSGNDRTERYFLSSDSDDENQQNRRKRKRSKYYNRKADFDTQLTMGSLRENGPTLVDISSEYSSDDGSSDDSSFSLFRRKTTELSKPLSEQPVDKSGQSEAQDQQPPQASSKHEEEIQYTPQQLEQLKKKADEETQYLLSNKIKPALALLFNFGLYGSRFIKDSPMKEFSHLFLLSLIYYTATPDTKEDYLNYIEKVDSSVLSKSGIITRYDPEHLAKEGVVHQGVIRLASCFREIDRNAQNPSENNRNSFDILEKEIGPKICCLIRAMKDKAPSLDIVIKKIKFYDSSYRVAVYISNEIMPSNFYFSPSIPFNSFPFWNVEMDFTFFCGTVMYGIMNMKHVFADPKLPFSLINQQIFPSISVLNTKFQLIMNEVSLIMPKDYNVKGKLINDISFFKFINWRLFNKTVISWNIKKQIIRGLYFYGIPFTEKNTPKSNKDIVKKMKFIFHAEEIEDFTFISFVSAILAYAKKYQPEINVGPYNIKTKVIARIINQEDSSEKVEIIEPLSKSSNPFEKVYVTDLRWIENSVVQNLSRNILIFQRARFYYNYFNKKVVFDMQKMPSLHQLMDFDFPIWSSYMEEIPTYWDNSRDIKLFNITANYGFLLFSELGRELLQISPNNVAVWRLNEIKSIRPLMPKIAEPIEFLFHSQTKIDRLEVIINVIQKSIEDNESPTHFKFLD